MADAENESSDVIQIVVPPPLKRPRTCTETTYSKCIICQVDSVEKLRKAKESSIANFISKLKIRRDDVYKRLANELQIVKDNGVL